MPSETTASLLDLLFALAAAPGPVGVSEVARQMGLTKTSVSRMLASLCREGIVVQDPFTQKYRSAGRMLELAALVYRRGDVRTRALPFMHRLRDLSRETVGLYLKIENPRVCVEELAGPALALLEPLAGTNRLVPAFAGVSGVSHT